jgi:hypothetical protein
MKAQGLARTLPRRLSLSRIGLRRHLRGLHRRNQTHAKVLAQVPARHLVMSQHESWMTDVGDLVDQLRAAFEAHWLKGSMADPDYLTLEPALRALQDLQAAFDRDRGLDFGAAEHRVLHAARFPVGEVAW